VVLFGSVKKTISKAQMSCQCRLFVSGNSKERQGECHLANDMRLMIG